MSRLNSNKLIVVIVVLQLFFAGRSSLYASNQAVFQVRTVFNVRTFGRRVKRRMTRGPRFKRPSTLPPRLAAERCIFRPANILPGPSFCAAT